MSSSNGPREWADETSGLRRDVTGMVRRMTVSLSASSVWQVLGTQLLNGTREVRDAEAFTGVGFYSRPPASSKTEALLVFPGGAAVPVIVATRDEDVRRKVAADLKPNETQIHNSETIFRIKADGTAELRAIAGVAESLSKHSDLTALAGVLDDWTPVANDGGAALKALLDALIGSGWPFGTSKLKAQ